MMEVPEQETTPEAPSLNRPRSNPVGSFWGWLIPAHIQHIFIPLSADEQLLPGETVQLEIHLAWYRNIMAVLIYGYWPALLVTAGALSVIGWLVAPSFGVEHVLAAQLPFYTLIGMAIYGLYERFQYLQWRLIKTNNRIIISKPQPDAWYLVDNIDINSMPKVVDANWAPPGMRRLFQMATGARDLYISLSGLQFEHGSAIVKDAIVIPDVLEEDARKLKEMVFK
jgi:hypothetical protein